MQKPCPDENQHPYHPALRSLPEEHGPRRIPEDHYHHRAGQRRCDLHVRSSAGRHRGLPAVPAPPGGGRRCGLVPARADFMLSIPYKPRICGFRRSQDRLCREIPCSCREDSRDAIAAVRSEGARTIEDFVEGPRQGNDRLEQIMQVFDGHIGLL